MTDPNEWRQSDQYRPILYNVESNLDGYNGERMKYGFAGANYLGFSEERPCSSSKYFYSSTSQDHSRREFSILSGFLNSFGTQFGGRRFAGA